MSSVSTPKYKIELRDNLIFLIRITDEADLELVDAKEIHAEFLKLANGNKYCVLMDGTNGFNISTEARNIVAGAEYSSARVAMAFVTRSIANALIANFFIKVNKPISPVKMFSDEADALSWLRKQMKQSQAEK